MQVYLLQDDRYLARALAHAAKSGVIASVKMLLEHGADATVVYGHVSFIRFALVCRTTFLSARWSDSGCCYY